MKNKVNVNDAVINGEMQPTVNARELWKALDSKQEFANWIKNRLADFEEGVDFTVDKIINGENKGRFAANEYTLTIDTAKHLAMLERNKIGKKIRQYFIEFEKEARKMLEDNIKFCQKVYADKCMENVSKPADIAASTEAVIEKINQQIMMGVEVEPEVLRYAWNIGRLLGKRLSRVSHYPDELKAFIMDFEPGTFDRAEVYERYCASCSCPMSARRFWPAIRAIRPCDEYRRAYKRFVVFK